MAITDEITTPVESGPSTLVPSTSQRRRAASIADEIERMLGRLRPQPVQAKVVAVSPVAVRVRRPGAITAGLTWIPYTGLAPDVGQYVTLVTNDDGSITAISNRVVTIGTGAGQVPTADVAVIRGAGNIVAGVTAFEDATVDGSSVVTVADIAANIVQGPIAGQNSGAAVRTNPTFINFRNRLTATLSGTGIIVDADVQTPATPSVPGAGFGNRDTRAIFIGPRVYNITKQLGIASASTFTVTAGRTYWFPVTFAGDVTIDQIGFDVTTLVSGSSAVVAVWSTDGDTDNNDQIRPKARIGTIGSIATATTGQKVASMSATMTEGLTYLIAIRFSAAVTVRSGVPTHDVFTTGTVGSTSRCAMGFSDTPTTAMTGTYPGIDLINDQLIIAAFRVTAIA